jgi:hypothetical protein
MALTTLIALIVGMESLKVLVLLMSAATLDALKANLLIEPQDLVKVHYFYLYPLIILQNVIRLVRNAQDLLNMTALGHQRESNISNLN